MMEVLSANVIDMKVYTKFDIQRVLDALRSSLPIELSMVDVGNVDVHEISASGWVTYSPVVGGESRRVRTSVLADNLVRANTELVDYVLERSA